MKNKSNVPLVHLIGIIALVAVIGFSMAACSGDDDDSGGGGGVFTLTDIPSQYNGKYALFGGTDNVFGYQSLDISEEIVTLVLIENNSVKIPLYNSSDFKAFSGNHTFRCSVEIYNQQTINLKNNNNNPSPVLRITFLDVTFSNGSATKAWTDHL